MMVRFMEDKSFLELDSNTLLKQTWITNQTAFALNLSW